jgi:hypothetical protein
MTAGKAKNTNVNLTNMPMEQVIPIQAGDIRTDPFLCRVSIVCKKSRPTRTSRKDKMIASRVLVNGRMPNTRHGHEDASKMTSTGGPN